MNHTKIKICGLTQKRDIEFINLLRPDFIGFVFAERSRRYITPERAAKLREILSPGIMPVGVFVNEPLENVTGLLQDGTIGMAQLHGRESRAYIASLRETTGKPVIKAFRIEHTEDMERAIQSPADFILLDHGTGGTGRIFDWSLIENVTRPFFLAGGLHAENVAAAVRLTHPYAVDTSSGVETNHIKDPEKMQKFIHAVRED
ncbi:MAG: phosphoribosylanthranilate isomerase [Intestinimonas sp.]|jgi:phosphoribosylanthranilate isomerase|nr:phosphoribosylanthranilate isomerase [Intestinimonas sp.]